MKKQDLVDKIGDIYSRLEEASSNASSLASDIRHIESLVEDLPSEPNEIEDDEDDTTPED